MFSGALLTGFEECKFCISPINMTVSQKLGTIKRR